MNMLLLKGPHWKIFVLETLAGVLRRNVVKKESEFENLDFWFYQQFFAKRGHEDPAINTNSYFHGRPKVVNCSIRNWWKELSQVLLKKKLKSKFGRKYQHFLQTLDGKNDNYIFSSSNPHQREHCQLTSWWKNSSCFFLKNWVVKPISLTFKICFCPFCFVKIQAQTKQWMIIFSIASSM